jgi:hypothetical protein
MDYRPDRLTSVVCKQMEHVIAGYLRQILEKSKWLYEGQHGFRPGYSCESQLVTVCQDIADTVDKGVRTDAIIIDFSWPSIWSNTICYVQKYRKPEWT